jgi:hypothetical protein
MIIKTQSALLDELTARVRSIPLCEQSVAVVCVGGGGQSAHCQIN